MIPELGHLALIIACVIACAALARAGSVRTGGLVDLLLWTYLQAGLVWLALGCMIWSFWISDFSVKMVAEQSHTGLPGVYRLCAVWGGHRGSLLLWAALQSAWVVYSARDRHTPQAIRIRSVVVLQGIQAFWLGFVLWLQPFARYLPVFPLEGSDLNPMLQDPAFVIHPPFLYLGYIGWCVPFARAVAAFGWAPVAAWGAWIRPAARAAWACLTIGIVLGSWWAYYELGWGGFWFWDPVENVALVPWLLGGGVLHLLPLMERGRVRSGFALGWISATFLSGILGTLLVRSGLVLSVHAFALDPATAWVVGGFVLAVVGSIFWICGRQLDADLRLCARSVPRVPETLSPRLWIWSVGCFGLAAVGVAMGTVYPVFAAHPVSVGPAYFQAVCVPVLGLAFAGMSVLQSPLRQIRERAGWVRCGVGVGVSTIAAIGWWTAGARAGSLLAFAVGAQALWVLCGLAAKSRLSLRARFGHSGMALCALGIVGASQYSRTLEVACAPGAEVVLGAYRVHFVGWVATQGSNYTGRAAEFSVTGPRGTVRLQPEHRVFSQQQESSETAIWAGVWEDVSISLGYPVDHAEVGVQIQIKPGVRWIWLGGLWMAIGIGVGWIRQRRGYGTITNRVGDLGAMGDRRAPDRSVVAPDPDMAAGVRADPADIRL